MDFLRFNRSDLLDIKKGNMAKISSFIANAYCHNTNKYIGPQIESFWTQILELNEEDGILIVMVSNYCTISISKDVPPFKFGEYLFIHKSFIKEYKLNSGIGSLKEWLNRVR